MEGFQNNSRRKFLRNLSGGIIAAGIACVPLPVFSKQNEIRLTILHTNDVHSHVDPFEDNHPKYPGQGGAAVRAALINQIRTSEKNVLLFDAGEFSATGVTSAGGRNIR